MSSGSIYNFFTEALAAFVLEAGGMNPRKQIHIIASKETMWKYRRLKKDLPNLDLAFVEERLLVSIKKGLGYSNLLFVGRQPV